MATLIRRNQSEVAPSSASVWDPFRVMRDVLRWDPFRELEATAAGDYGLFSPSFDVKENKDGYVFRADLPGVRDLQRFAVGADLAAVLALRQHSARLTVEHLELELVATALFIDDGAQQEGRAGGARRAGQTSGRRAAVGWQRGGARRQRHDLATRRKQPFAQRLSNALSKSRIRRLAGNRQHQDLGSFRVRDAAREQEHPPKSSRPEFDHAAHGPFGSPQSQDSPFILPSSVVVSGGRAG